MKRILSVVLFGLLLMPVAWAPEAAADDAVVEAQAAEGALGLTREQRSQIQEALAARGFDVGPADGSFGPRTREAIRAWQHGYTSGMSGDEGATGYLNTIQAQLLLGGSGESRRSIRPRQSSEGASAAGPTYEETWEWLRGYLGKVGFLSFDRDYNAARSDKWERFPIRDEAFLMRFEMRAWDSGDWEGSPLEVGDFDFEWYLGEDRIERPGRHQHTFFDLTSVRLVRHREIDPRLIEFVCLEEYGQCILWPGPDHDRQEYASGDYLLCGDGNGADRVWKALTHMQRLAEESKGGDLF